MATLLLTTVGTIVGGPIGGAIGAFAGQQIDAAIFGGGSYEGPRLKDLAVTTSSYGQPIARHFGTMRAAGTVIWATDLKESRESSGGGKGKPKTTSYSYSASFAVAISSRPIHDVGRIWADGDLLRGKDGDLKTSGTLRIHRGAFNQAPDPLILAAEGESCPAFRDCSYIVFEDLELGDFGNRIPALTFEVMGDPDGKVDLAQILAPSLGVRDAITLDGLGGMSDEGGEAKALLRSIDQVFPLLCTGDTMSPSVSLRGEPDIEGQRLPQALSWTDEEAQNGAFTSSRRRSSATRPQIYGLRYYDSDRDYQPGVQRASGMSPEGRELLHQFPGNFTASKAQQVCNDMARRARWHGETLTWRIAELDPAISVGEFVRLPDSEEVWLITDWEWLDRGIELQLERVVAGQGQGSGGDTGAVLPPQDLTIPATILRAFELPSDGSGDSNTHSVHAAVSAASAGYRGAHLYLDRMGELVSIGSARPGRCVIGSLESALNASPAIRLEAQARFNVVLPSSDLGFEDTTVSGLASGENRLLVGDEVIQFLRAEQISDLRWTLSGLLRGRAGTEMAASAGHAAATDVVLLNDRVTELDAALVPSSQDTRLAAIGLGDKEPQFAQLSNPGITRRPLAPVHPCATRLNNGDLHCRWTRRARGQWRWEDFVDVARVEENLLFLIAYGPPESPHASWHSSSEELTIDAVTEAAFVAAHGPDDLSVRQVGTFGQSPATLLTRLS